MYKAASFRILLLPFAFPCYAAAQGTSSSLVFYQLDSIAKCSAVPAYFGGLYLKTTVQLEEQLTLADPTIQLFTRRFENTFASYFLNECDAFTCGKANSEVWREYFTHRRLSPVQYQLLGINAHINGDLWQALIKTFSLRELRQYEKHFTAYEESLLKVYDAFYSNAIHENRRLRLLHEISGGLDKTYGKRLLITWRKRQVQLALMYYTNQPRFYKKLRELKKKKSRIDKLVVRFL